MKLNLLWNLLLFLAAVYLCVTAAVFFLQSGLVYCPQIGRSDPATPADRGLPFEAPALKTSDGESLSAWWVPARGRARGAALLFHGNAGSIAGRLDYAVMFRRLGYATFLVDYRGYGRSTGEPSEEGTYRDAEAAWAWLASEKELKPGEVVIVGESLGCAVAAWLAERTEPRALVLASGFTSVPEFGAAVYPFLPVRLISRFSYDTLGAVGRVKAPVLVAHSATDDLIPFAHGEALFAAVKGPGRFLKMEGGHNEAFLFARPEWTAQLGDFLESAEAGKAGVK